MQGFPSSSMYIMESANIFVGDHNPHSSNHLTALDVRLPVLERWFVEHAAGGSPVAIQIPMHIQPLEAAFHLTGWQPSVMVQIGSGTRTFSIYGAIRDRMRGGLMEAKAIIQGDLGKMIPDPFARGNNQGHEYEIHNITHYDLTVQGQKIYLWDFASQTLEFGDYGQKDFRNEIFGFRVREIRR